MKFLSYEVAVFWYNRYSIQQPLNVKDGIFLSLSTSETNCQLFRTSYGFPSAPVDLLAYSLTPDLAFLYWKMPVTLNAPPIEIKYRVFFILNFFYCKIN